MGDTVETIHGEKLEVLDVKTLPAKTKKGVVVHEGVKMYLAQSGDHKCWFPESNLKSK